MADHWAHQLSLFSLKHVLDHRMLYACTLPVPSAWMKAPHAAPETTRCLHDSGQCPVGGPVKPGGRPVRTVCLPARRVDT